MGTVPETSLSRACLGFVNDFFCFKNAFLLGVLNDGLLRRRDLKLLRKFVSVLGLGRLGDRAFDGELAVMAVVEAGLSAGLAVFLLRKLNLPNSEGGPATVVAEVLVLDRLVGRVVLTASMLIPVG